MSPTTAGGPKLTLVEALVHRLRACRTTPDGVASPAVILWTDPDEQWLPLAQAIRGRMPELLTLGDYDLESRTGPTIWLRCVLEGTVDVPGMPDAPPPVFYLPGVARQDLRAGEDCPRELKPLVELMFRGTLWLQRSGRDWTLTALLTSEDGLALEMARDQDTLSALHRAVREVADVPVSQLMGRRLQADDFDRLLTTDLFRDLLRWISDPSGWRASVGEERWDAFRNQCRTQLEFDPEEEGELGAARRLGEGEGPWAVAWERFEEAPTAYPGIPEVLRRSKPSDLFLDRSRWPGDNEADEAALRSELRELVDTQHRDACDRVLELEKEHGERRSWVWAQLGQAPMAEVLRHLAELATHVRSSLGGGSPDELADAYVDGPWRADAAAWKAISCCTTADEKLVHEVVRFLMKPGLDEGARELQRLVDQSPLPTHTDASAVGAPEGGCLMFADGLRYDLGQLLAERLEAVGCRIHMKHRWAALPTVTATAKPAVTPLADSISGEALPADFSPSFRDTGKATNAARIRSELEAAGYQVLGGELGDWPASDQARGWTEEGRIDSRGHKLGIDLARHLDAELDRLAERVIQLLDGGWSAVRIVTDHGWLLLPGGLPKIDLPKHLTASRWSRAATVAGASRVSVPTAPWHWNPAERFATAPGIACFNASPPYSHGGISLQECVIPDLLVEREGGGAVRASIESLAWKGMRCVVRGSAKGGEVRADLRLGAPLGSSVVTSPKDLDESGEASLLMAGDEHEDADLVAVLLDADGTVLAQQSTRVGEST